MPGCCCSEKWHNSPQGINFRSCTSSVGITLKQSFIPGAALLPSALKDQEFIINAFAKKDKMDKYFSYLDLNWLILLISNWFYLLYLKYKWRNGLEENQSSSAQLHLESQRQTLLRFSLLFYFFSLLVKFLNWVFGFFIDIHGWKT